MDIYARQHTVDAYRFELGNIGVPAVVQRYVDQTLNNIDNCLARRVAYGVGAEMPAIGSGPTTNVTNSTTPYPSLYPLNPGQETNKSNAGLTVAVVAGDNMFSPADMQAMMPLLSAQQVGLAVVAPRIGTLQSGVTANASFTTTSNLFYDAVFIGSIANSTIALTNGPNNNAMAFVMEAYGHGKAIGALGFTGQSALVALGIAGEPGVYSGSTSDVTQDVLTALSGPVRFWQRFPTDNVTAICGSSQSQ